MSSTATAKSSTMPSSSSSSSLLSSSSSHALPIVVRDARFRAGRALVVRPLQPQQHPSSTTDSNAISTIVTTAADVFARLLEEVRTRFGPDHVETVPAYYEYGNALFRQYQRNQEEVHDDDDDDNKGTRDNSQTMQSKAADNLKTTTANNSKTTSTTTTTMTTSTAQQHDMVRQAAAAAAERRAAQHQATVVITTSSTTTATNNQQTTTPMGNPNNTVTPGSDSVTPGSDFVMDNPAVVPSPESGNAGAYGSNSNQALPIQSHSEDDKAPLKVEAKKLTKGELEGNENKHDNNNDSEDVTEDKENDMHLALEMMETAWSILDQYHASYAKTIEVTTAPPSIDAASRTNAAAIPSSYPYQAWVEEQLPRILTGIGDVLSSLGRHADAADAYLRALRYRQESVDGWVLATAPPNQTAVTTAFDSSMLRFLKSRRLLVECLVLIAEELLTCEPNHDVQTTESKTVLVHAAERVDYARGYYDKARDELQETVLLMGQLVASSCMSSAAPATTASTEQKQLQADLIEEKENICFAATLVMGVGTTLADWDVEQQETSTAAIAAAAAAALPIKSISKKRKMK